MHKITLTKNQSIYERNLIMKKAKIISAAMALALTFSAGAGFIPQFNNTSYITASAATAGMYKVTGDGVRLRKSASLNGTILGLMYRGETVTTSGTERNGFVQVYRTKTRQTGWVSKKYIVLLYH